MKSQPGNEWRREVAERLREAYLASLQPDIVHVLSLFEGYVDDAVTSVGAFAPQIPTVVTLYDLIPLLNPKDYLAPYPPIRPLLRAQDRLFEESEWLAGYFRFIRGRGEGYPGTTCKLPLRHIRGSRRCISISKDDRSQQRHPPSRTR